VRACVRVQSRAVVVGRSGMSPTSFTPKGDNAFPPRARKGMPAVQAVGARALDLTTRAHIDAARTRGNHYGEIDSDGGIDVAIRAVSVDNEVILLHADRRRQRLLVNLIAQFNSFKIDHILVLGFSAETCRRMRVGGRIGCVTSRHQIEAMLHVSKNFVAWLQRFRLIKRLAERGINVMALDTDVAVRANPYPSLRSAFGGYRLVTTFDYKGGFANTNIGFMYLRNATIGTAINGLFLEFERRIALALQLLPGLPSARKPTFKNQYLWDQNLWNKVLLSDMAGRAVFLPDGADSAWTSAHREQLRARLYWHEATMATPPELQVRSPWGTSTERYLWYELRRHPAIGAIGATVGAGAASEARAAGGHGMGMSSGGSGERVMLAPAWLVAMENGIGHKGKHWLYGATPTPALLVHYTCTTQTEAARAWPLRLFGHWHEAAVSREAGAAVMDAGATGGEGETDDIAARGASSHLGRAVAAVAPHAMVPPPPPQQPPRLLALVDGTLAHPLPPLAWGTLNAIHAVLGALASLSGRTLVAPAINCTGVADRKKIEAPEWRRRPGQPKTRGLGLSTRCFWHVHSPHGVRCVLRIGGCGDLAAPHEAEEAAAATASRGAATPSVVHVDLSGEGESVAGTRGVEALLAHTRAHTAPIAPAAAAKALASSTPLLYIKLTLPAADRLATADSMDEREHQRLLDHLLGRGRRAPAVAIDPRLHDALRAFRRRCHDLSNGPTCNNICS